MSASVKLNVGGGVAVLTSGTKSSGRDGELLENTSAEVFLAAWNPLWPTEEPRLCCWRCSVDEILDVAALLDRVRLVMDEPDLKADGWYVDDDSRTPPLGLDAPLLSTGEGWPDGAALSRSFPAGSLDCEEFSQSKSHIASASCSYAKSMSSSHVLSFMMSELTVATVAADIEGRFDMTDGG